MQQGLVWSQACLMAMFMHIPYTSPTSELTNNDNSKVLLVSANSREEDVTFYNLNV